MSLDRKAILDFKDVDVTTVFVKEFGGDVCVATLSALEADKIKDLGESGVPANVGLVILGACDAKGERLFTDEDAPVLGMKPAKALTTIANMVLKHNAMSGDADEEAKNALSETDQGDSASASPSPSDAQ